MDRLRCGCVARAVAALLAAAWAGESARAALPAFPGAEGFGASATGGRGGRVIHVTNLNGDGPGSLQAACNAAGPRIVVFDVSGVIVPARIVKGRRFLVISHSNITIAGQTAPGAGITILGTITTLRGVKDRPVRDVVIRFVRLRPEAARGTGRNLRAVELSNSDRIILDHVSGSWSIDDCFDLYTARNVTVQWCGIEESDIWLEGGDEPHNFGMITGYGGPRPIAVHHSLLANHRERTPACGSYPTDFRNNVIYNSGTGMGLLVRRSYAAAFAMNIVGNYVKAGPGGIIGHRIYLPPCTAALGSLGPYRKGLGRFYLAGNYIDWCGGYVQPWRKGPKAPPNVVDEPFAFPAVRTQVAEEAFEEVLAHAGCLPRDVVSRRTVREVLSGTGSWGRHAPAGGLLAGLAPAKPPRDSDGDGMPDDWERACGLDPDDPADAAGIVPKGASRGDRHAGYTYIEFYLNELADRLIARALTKARLEPTPPRPWDRPAKGLSPMASPHATVAEMVEAIRRQDVARQADPKARRRTTITAWFAVQQLGRLGPKAAGAVPELIKLLDGDDPCRVSFAAWALGAMGPAAGKAVPGLTAVLSRPWPAATGKWQWTPVGFAAWALGRIGPEARAAVPVLAKVISEGRHPRAVRPALYALSRMGPAAKAAMPVLLRHVSDIHAAKALANIGPPALEGLAKAFSDGRPRVRIGALRALGLMGPVARPASPAIVKLLKDPSAEVRAWAARALGRIDPASPRVVRALRLALADADMNVRHSAVRGLGRAGPSAAGAVSELARVLRADPSEEVRFAAARSLGRIGPAASAVLSAALKADPSASVRRWSARALGRVGPGAVDALVAALADPDGLVRREAAWALGRIGPPARRAVGALKEALRDGDYVVPVAAAEALRRIGGGGGGPSSSR